MSRNSLSLLLHSTVNHIELKSQIKYLGVYILNGNSRIVPISSLFRMASQFLYTFYSSSIGSSDVHQTSNLLKVAQNEWPTEDWALIL